MNCKEIDHTLINKEKTIIEKQSETMNVRDIILAKIKEPIKKNDSSRRKIIFLISVGKNPAITFYWAEEKKKSILDDLEEKLKNKCLLDSELENLLKKSDLEDYELLNQLASLMGENLDDL